MILRKFFIFIPVIRVQFRMHASSALTVPHKNLIKRMAETKSSDSLLFHRIKYIYSESPSEYDISQ
jgi:hypothetical protein